MPLHEQLGEVRHLVEREVKDVRTPDHVIPRRHTGDHGVDDHDTRDIGERAQVRVRDHAAGVVTDERGVRTEPELVDQPVHDLRDRALSARRDRAA